MAKPFYKNLKTGNYGILEGDNLFITPGSVDSYLTLRLLVGVGGIVERSHRTEQVNAKDLIEVTPNEVERALLD
ncbi:hypothetical protein FJR38_08285 [Anabaena sp. UHCC 0253]|uniref:hypothetical protein n=1 Tax=Anabaena sp. UHCC 0253 TaxID=2590019 RepID=UPI0014489BDA|nr:hypothetical protein [Anabaena sp. UHCC 0253]MTJ52657.1 hypothetical protein [Anabaena sp. UHCC 0253]